MKKTLFTIVYFFWFGSLAWGQPFFSQQQLITRIQTYLSKTPVLYTFAVFAKDKYSPGDTVFFKAYFFDLANRPVKGQAILQVEVFNETGLLVEKISVNTKDGVGYSQLMLPDTLSSGIYRIQIYNEWMKNFGTSTFFEKSVQVVKDKRISRKTISPEVQFFPEGGTLVAGVPNKVVIVSNQRSKTITIQTQNGSELSQVAIDESGTGFLVFTPKPDDIYRARLEGSSHLFQLPVANKDGISVLLTPSSTHDYVKALFTVPENSAFKDQDILTVVVADQEVQFSSTLNFRNKDAITLSIPQRGIPEGIAQLLLFDQTGKILAQRCFLVQVTGALSMNHLNIGAKTLPQRGVQRIDVRLEDDLGQHPGEFAVSVVHQTFQVVEEAVRMPDPRNVNQLLIDRFHKNLWQRQDNLLVGFPGFHDWSSIITSAEWNSPYVLRTMLSKKGIAKIEGAGAIPDSTVLTFYLQKHFMGYETTVGKDGTFDVTFLFDFYGDDELFYMAEAKGKYLPNISVKWTEHVAEVKPDLATEEIDEPDPYAQFVQKNRILGKSYSFFSTEINSSVELPKNPNAEFEDEFMGADVSINVEDYQIFPTMEELIREVIPSLQHRKVRGNSIVRVVFSIPSIIPTGDPLYIIDGVMTKNTDFFLSLKPAELLFVKIERELSKLSRLGAIGKNGVVYVQTKNQQVANRLRAESRLLPVRGLNKPIGFRGPVYNSVDNWRRPDFRLVPYWNPSVQTDSNGEASISFKVSDDLGPMVIKITGFTKDGRPFSFSEEFETLFVPTPKN
ncbi:MAG: hypothetical protein ACOYXA_17445 [Bacteroidota bacterium]